MSDFFAKSHHKPEPEVQPRAPAKASGPPPSTVPAALPGAATPKVPLHGAFLRRSNAFQLHNAYIIEESDEGIQIIDQHALHERILREALEARVKEARILSQRLLVPAIVRLTPKEFVSIMELRDSLLKLGVEFTDFGQNSIAIQAMPQMLDRVEAGQFVRDILDELAGGREQPSLDQKLDRIINLAACKGAVKAGQPLAPEEIGSLLEQRERLQHPSVCAHGRPSTILLTLDYLRKQFARK